jgi:hypothetical protein
MALKGTWTPERIIAAFHAWVDQTGGPPMAYEWDVSAGRKHGLIGAEVETKWEREHPLWPSRGAVEWHFGSWQRALEAAGLPFRPAPEMTLNERVDAARRMIATGLSRIQVADQLQVTPGSVRNYLLARRCATCDGYIIRGDAGTCRDCARRVRQEQRREFTAAEIVDLVRQWADETGAPPTEADWRRLRDSDDVNKWEAEYPRWPIVRDVLKQFGAFPDAITAAGFRPTVRFWTLEEARESIVALADRLGHTPTTTELADAATRREAPSVPTIISLFGSTVREAIIACGLPPGRPQQYTDDEILDRIARYEHEHRVPASEPRWRAARRRPDAETIRRHFGSFPIAVRLASERVRRAA